MLEYLQKNAINYTGFLLAFTLFMPKLNALNSLAIILAAFIVAIVYKKRLFQELLNIPNIIKMAYITFLASLIVASIAIGDKQSLTRALNWVYYTIPLLLMYLFSKLVDNKNYILYGFVLGLAYTTIYGLYDYIVFDRKRLGGLYNINATATMFDIMLPITAVWFFETWRSKKIKGLLALVVGIIIVLSVVALFLTLSRGGILGTILGLILTSIIYIIGNVKKKLFIGLIVFLITGIGLFALYNLNGSKFNRSYDNERILLIESSYNMWNDHKLFGVGLMNWKQEYQERYILPQAKEPNLGMPHNIVAYYFSATGLIGGVSFVLFSLLLLIYLSKNIASIDRQGLYCLGMLWAFVAISVHGLVDIGITKKEVYRMFCGCLGLTIAMIEKSRIE